MAKLAGKSMFLLVNGTVIAASKSFTLNVEVDNPDATTKDDDAWGNSIYGSKKWSVTFEALYDPAAVYNLEEYFDQIDTDTAVVVEMAITASPGGGLLLRGNANISGFTLTAAITDPISFTGGFTGKGELTRGTVASS